jgi:cytochrome c556
MKFAGKLLAIGLMSVAGIVIAADATNPAVKSRQEAMDSNGMNAKILGDMAGGKADFDAAKAAEAAAAIAATAATVPDLFRANEEDPKSKAKPEIWASYSDFETKAGDLMKAAQSMDTSTVEGVAAGMGAVGGACGACHKAYKS